MSRSSGRAQVEPTAALAAVLALTIALGVYASAYAAVPTGHATPTTADDDALAALVADLGPGPADPATLRPAVRTLSHTGSLNATLRTPTRVWTVGPPRPRRADVAAAPLPVRVGPDRVRPGRLTVAVWP
ncbi:hypothetical protein J2752_002086 [Halarchaeum rubridurum]|uniref:Uncharacterized protein n=1 Tax=Halarchaeum rubridurum TaxID=489911 RepID=A0A830FZW0_9EURY|nr:hypothetical protein [Halarchaeum rubridurum]MBP1955174.1 hypothetical protein [Halarchaeum rubridurum]GGM68343.1 hypothetical protein GCM10009017_18210 [Halarchaeum rubridurum]